MWKPYVGGEKQDVRSVPVFIWLLTQQCGRRPQQICSSIKHVGAWPDQRCFVHLQCQCGCCTCVCVRAPVRAACHAVKCVLEGCHWGSQDNPTFSLHACSSSESDHYHVASHHCPGASKFTFGQKHTILSSSVCRTKPLLSRQEYNKPGLAIKTKQLSLPLSQHI